MSRSRGRSFPNYTNDMIDAENTRAYPLRFAKYKLHGFIQNGDIGIFYFIFILYKYSSRRYAINFSINILYMSPSAVRRSEKYWDYLQIFFNCVKLTLNVHIFYIMQVHILICNFFRKILISVIIYL